MCMPGVPCMPHPRPTGKEPDFHANTAAAGDVGWGA